MPDSCDLRSRPRKGRVRRTLAAGTDEPSRSCKEIYIAIDELAPASLGIAKTFLDRAADPKHHSISV